jgi:hypothetical protein
MGTGGTEIGADEVVVGDVDADVAAGESTVVDTASP